MQDLTNISKIALALAKAQSEFPLIAKTKTAHIQTKNGGMYTYDYADLAVLIGATRQPLAKNELSFTQFVEYEDVFLKVTTILMHSSGEYLLTTFKTRVVGDDLKAIGTAITYIRRYSLAAILGIASDEDKDDPAGQGSTRQGNKGGRQVATSNKGGEPPQPDGPDGSPGQAPNTSAPPNGKAPDGKGDGKTKPKPQHTVESVRAYLTKAAAEGTAINAEGWGKINRTVTRLATELGLEDAINAHSMIEGVQTSDEEARSHTVQLLEACETEKAARELEGK